MTREYSNEIIKLNSNLLAVARFLTESGKKVRNPHKYSGPATMVLTVDGEEVKGYLDRDTFSILYR